LKFGAGLDDSMPFSTYTRRDNEIAGFTSAVLWAAKLDNLTFDAGQSFDVMNDSLITLENQKESGL